MIVHTSAVVFKAIDYGETSKIVTLFTEQHGKIAVMVKGAKRPKNKFSGLIEPGNLLDVVYYHKPSRSVQILTEASLMENLINLRMDFKKMATVTSAIELTSQLLHENEVNEPVFNFVKNFLVWLDETEHPPQQVFPYLQIRLSQLIGLGLQMERESFGTSGHTKGYLHIESGLVTGSNETSSGTYKLSQNQFHYVSLSLQGKGSHLFGINFYSGELKELVSLLDRYLKYHVEGLRDRKSDAIFEQILQD